MVGQSVIDVAPSVTADATGSVIEQGIPSSDRFELRQTIGSGSQGTTWLAFDRELQREVAVKAFDLGRMSDWKDFDLFERECKVLASLDHPGIPKFIASWADPEVGRYFLAMDLVVGESLESRMDAGTSLDESEVTAILRDTLDILSHLHARHPPVIHRDIKPANLLVGAGGTVSLVDFGGVRVALKPDGGSTVVGTFGYMAPEQLHGQATAVTDTYSLGVTMIALATGTPGDALPRKGLKIDVAKVMAPSPLREVLSAMVNPDPDLRPASADAVVQMLDRQLRERRPVSSAPLGSAHEHAAEADRRRRRSGRDSNHDVTAAVDPDAAGETGRSPGMGSLFIWGASTVGKLMLAAIMFGILPLVFWLSMRRRHVRNNPKKRAKLKRRQQRLERKLESARKRVDRLARRHDPDGDPRQWKNPRKDVGRDRGFKRSKGRHGRRKG